MSLIKIGVQCSAIKMENNFQFVNLQISTMPVMLNLFMVFNILNTNRITNKLGFDLQGINAVEVFLFNSGRFIKSQ
jgi:hypothetical protein